MLYPNTCHSCMYQQEQGRAKGLRDMAVKVTVTEHGPNDTDGATVMVRVGGTVTTQEYTRAIGAHNAAKIAADRIGASYVQRIPHN